MLGLPTPHGDKLRALAHNRKLPIEDQIRIAQAVERYQNWLQQLKSVQGTYQEIVSSLVALLNDYKRYVEVDLIFDSNNDFLYRQKGQLKLDNTIIEEFLPIFVMTALADQLQPYELSFGPTTCFSSIRFESSIKKPIAGGGLQLREKDHDFVVGRRLFIRTSHQPNFQESAVVETHLAYVAAECKTNLDKTMFQEAAATALDVKTAVPGAKYYLLCEWLDMTSISTSTTAIDEIIILRKARRLPADIRGRFNTIQGRQQYRTIFIEYLEANPLAVETFTRFLNHILSLIKDDTEGNILTRGYF
ncbi:MAG: Bpu10I family restriction endonuclease [Anaerolineae bacterium]|nr:Bpu10I family restriction endonuclease [Anaerolineae bacterium]